MAKIIAKTPPTVMPGFATVFSAGAMAGTDTAGVSLNGTSTATGIMIGSLQVS